MKTKEEIFYMVHKSPSLAADEWYEVQTKYEHLNDYRNSEIQAKTMEAMMKTRQYTPAMTKEEIEKTARDLKKSAQNMIPPKGD
jgi:3-methyladenine DNA glycosylase Tag